MKFCRKETGLFIFRFLFGIICLDKFMAETTNYPKKRYSDEELEEFREIIRAKLDKAYKEYESLRSSFVNGNDNSDSDTAQKFNILEESSSVMQKAEAERLADRQLQFIKKLEAALTRIDNKTYGICRVTGELISKERLRAVPHATLSIEAKTRQ